MQVRVTAPASAPSRTARGAAGSGALGPAAGSSIGRRSPQQQQQQKQNQQRRPQCSAPAASAQQPGPQQQLPQRWAQPQAPAACPRPQQQQPPRPQQPCQHHHHQQQQQRPRRLGRGGGISAAAAPATASVDVDELVGPTALQPEVFEVVTYALKLAWTAETYSVHSWMVLLGLLKKESYTACQVLKDLGLEDIHGAWNEVLWALNVTDGLAPRAFTPRVAWGERAALILQGAVRFGGWAGRERVATEDLLMAFAASDVLAALFPDVDLSFDRVKRAVEKRTGCTYDLPGYEGAALASQDMFL